MRNSRKSNSFLIVSVSGAPCHQVVEPDLEFGVADELHHLDVVADVVLVGGEVLTQLRGELVEHGVDAVDPAALVDQLRRRLLPDPGHTGQVVGVVAPQGGVLDVVDGLDAGSLEDAGLVVEGVVAHAPLVVEDLDVGVLDELIAVAVAGDHDDVVAAIPPLGGEGGDDVVGLETDRLQGRDRHRVEHLAHEPHLLAQDVGGGLALGLVRRGHLVPEGRLGPIERDRDAIGLVVLHQVDQHRREPEDRVGHLTRCRRHVGGQGEERPVGERISIDEHHGRHWRRP